MNVSVKTYFDEKVTHYDGARAIVDVGKDAIAASLGDWQEYAKRPASQQDSGALETYIAGEKGAAEWLETLTEIQSLPEYVKTDADSVVKVRTIAPGMMRRGLARNDD